MFRLFLLVGVTQRPLTLRPASENFDGETLSFETDEGALTSGMTVVWVLGVPPLAVKVSVAFTFSLCRASSCCVA